MEPAFKAALLGEVHNALAAEAFKGLQVTAVEFTISIKATVVDPRDDEEGAIEIAFVTEEQI